MVNRSFVSFALILTACFAGLFAYLVQVQLPSTASPWDLFLPSDNFDLLLIQSYSLPRVAMAILAGGTLGFSSLLLQQVMNNPLASDNTLGISSGAQFTLFLATLFTPSWLENGSSMIALLGAGLSLILVISLAWRKTMSPLLLILAGLVVNLYFGSFSSMIMLFYPEESRGLAQWGAGSLVQESWRDSQILLFNMLPCLLIIALLIRPFSILSLNDSNAQSLGVPVGKLRFIGIAVSAYLIAAVVSAVGMLGFVGLASATLVRQMGVRTFKGQLIGAFLAGSLLLSVTDLALQILSLAQGINLPTGAVTALLGTPLLLWLMFRALGNSGRVTENAKAELQKMPKILPLVLALGLILSVFLALTLGKNGQGWNLNFSQDLFELRSPRVWVAMAVGILLSTAGVLLQRLTLNPMASPELLGVSSGTSMGILAVLFLFSANEPSIFWLAGISGAFLALLVLSAINQKSGMLPEKVLLTGISLSALFDTLQRIAIASGDPRASQLIAWTSGSTQALESSYALPFLGLAIMLFLTSLIFSRWLEVLALQATVAQALGLNLKQVRWTLILFSALLTALATLIIGPLSFIGLLVPHLARFLGVTKAHQQLWVSALLGSLIMIFADWLGRQMLFPYEVPAGLVATLIGGTYFLVTVRKV
ncbi:Fe3+-hydroxamate ABC transporter permease FhuB [Pasteurellaceae bacterium RH1A]|nr:Fe3+-hydroxamate ABC transporter permease FhuB [Pasteurellaceae bacterium RH1A]